MNDVVAKSDAPASYAEKAWQSDVIVDLIKHYGFPYIALNPGASYRGLHDSLVNYGGNQPPMLLCQHEKIAVQIAHGYAKATGKPMVAIVHDVVGMLHATMGIYYAYIDRCPVFVIGATGPMDESRRRPFIDWIHTANVNGEQLRHYVKWDYQPSSIEGVPDSFARAYAAMMTEPQGPIYMCYDAWLQEQPLTKDVALPKPSDNKVPVPMAADAKALADVADRLLAAKYPVLMAEYVARSEGGFDNLVALAETVGAAVFDVHARLNFPNRHKLNLSCEKEIFRDADLILTLDTRDWEKSTHFNDRTKRQVVPHYPPNCEMIEIGFGEINLSKWSMDYARMPTCSLRVLGDTLTAIPELTRICRERIAKNPALAKSVAERTEIVAKKHDALFKKWADEAKKDWDGLPITLPRLASEMWDVIKDEDWVLTACNLQDWVYKLWDFDKPYRHPRPGARHRHADRHLARRRAGAPRQRPARHRHPARRRPHVRRRRAVERGEEQHPDAHRHVQQPRLLQRLGAPDSRRQFPRHAGRSRLHRPGHRRPGARLCDDGQGHGLVRRRPDRKACRHCARACAAPSRRSRPASRRWSIRWCGRVNPQRCSATNNVRCRRPAQWQCRGRG